MSYWTQLFKTVTKPILLIAMQYYITERLHNGASISRPHFILQANVWNPPKNKTPSYDESLGCCYNCHYFMSPGQDSSRYRYPRSPCTTNRQHCNTELQHVELTTGGTGLNWVPEVYFQLLLRRQVLFNDENWISTQHFSNSFIEI